MVVKSRNFLLAPLALEHYFPVVININTLQVFLAHMLAAGRQAGAPTTCFPIGLVSVRHQFAHHYFYLFLSLSPPFFFNSLILDAVLAARRRRRLPLCGHLPVSLPSPQPSLHAPLSLSLSLPSTQLSLTFIASVIYSIGSETRALCLPQTLPVHLPQTVRL